MVPRGHAHRSALLLADGHGAHGLLVPARRVREGRAGQRSRRGLCHDLELGPLARGRRATEEERAGVHHRQFQRRLHSRPGLQRRAVLLPRGQGALPAGRVRGSQGLGHRGQGVDDGDHGESAHGFREELLVQQRQDAGEPRGSWWSSTLKAIAPDDPGKWGAAKVPGGYGNNGGSFLALPKSTKNPQAAFEFLTWLTSAQNQVTSYTELQIFPSTPASFDSPCSQPAIRTSPSRTP
ncbi:extracellular solute-binding protein [Frondihabitans sucicola]|uniref:extracellular solute-binding protein n=1 Tax=Frondihabitans sucicola TaxID=1268041 RepID=UPI00330685D4